eukprot:TRINITY_DN16669_c0_g1_i1.p1 TRINITY_DN16669_c0_g1~~TRINITY_DN16669_c0_g1_i1.p1  ORF type:complete len:199 (-),score=54.10 TRINITY_DN16669_c0_g1_i1:76-672(-)
MGLLWSYFVGQEVYDRDVVILELKTQRDNLKLYSQRINGVIEREVVIAKKLALQGKTDQAKFCLKKKKFQEGLLKRAQDTLVNLEQMITTIEWSEIQLEVMKSLRLGNDALKELNSQMNIDEVENLLLETAEETENQREISTLLAGKLTEEDEEEVMREFQKLTQEPDSEIELDLPNVPKHQISKISSTTVRSEALLA